jgi:hypothetical protein
VQTIPRHFECQFINGRYQPPDLKKKKKHIQKFKQVCPLCQIKNPTDATIKIQQRLQPAIYLIRNIRVRPLAPLPTRLSNDLRHRVLVISHPVRVGKELGKKASGNVPHDVAVERPDAYDAMLISSSSLWNE